MGFYIAVMAVYDVLLILGYFLSLYAERNVFSVSQVPYGVWALFAAFTLLPLWGILGTLISEVKGKAARVPSGRKKILSRDWHYRFNRWWADVFTYGKWKRPTSECEYWAETVSHMALIAPPLFVFCQVIFIFMQVFSWLVGFCPNPKFLRISYSFTAGEDAVLLLRKSSSAARRRQWVGPGLIAIAVVYLLIQVLVQIPVHYMILAGIGVGSFLGACLVVLGIYRFFEKFGRGIKKHVVRPFGRGIAAPFVVLFYFIVTRTSKHCRLIEYPIEQEMPD